MPHWIGVALIVACVAATGSAITCYTCDGSSLFAGSDCPAEGFQTTGSPPTIECAGSCFKSVMYGGIGRNVIVTRSCTHDKQTERCNIPLGSNGLQYGSCVCNSNYCNTAGKSAAGTTATVLACFTAVFLRA
ncbi:hypothetical protein BV898_11192 [Hypsibius exemplaris]|uniref:Protein quiver n=1 Tax=Hypsibius exemplaris TaxID=2072580 RepID=A0A1W0WHK4_HYPEX|nr:hypothetical protein BV898_11192 [Hypsibius exemplaris]